MAIGLHRRGPMLDVCSRAPYTNRRVAFFCWSLFVLLPALASAQALTVTATWDPSPPSDQVSSYEVCIGTSSLSCNIKLVKVNVSQTSHTFAPPPGQLVYLAVRAINPKGRGAYSAEQTFSIPSFGALTSRSTARNAAITPIGLSVIDPDGSRLTFTHTGLPLGVAMNSATGQITGAPTNAGTYNVTIFVTDGLKTVSRSFVWTVTAGAAADRTPPTLTITSHASGLLVTSANQTIRGTATDSGKGGSGIAAVRINGQAATGGVVGGSNTANWSLAIALSSGSNTITIDAVDGAGNVQMQQITLLLGVSGSSNNSSGGGTSPSPRPSPSPIPSPSSGPLMITSFTSNLASPEAAGTSITFSAVARGGRAPYQFKWLILNNGTWTVIQSWSPSNTYTWRPTSGAYRVAVWVRDATTTADVGTVNTSVPFRIRGSAAAPTSPVSVPTPPVSAPSAPVSSPTPTAGPLQVAGLTSSVASPQAPGSNVTFTASATGGVGAYQFKWLILHGGTWTVVREWSPLSMYQWRPTSTGAHRVAVWVRDATMMEDVSNASVSVPYRIRRD